MGQTDEKRYKVNNRKKIFTSQHLNDTKNT